MNKTHLLTKETLDLLNNISTNDFIKFKCVKCGKECRVQLSKKSNIPRFKTLLCSNCHRENTSLKLYGTNNVSKNPAIVNKIKNTTGSKRKEISATIKMTWNNKSPEEKEKINDKRKITVKARFGGLSSQSSPEVQNKTKQTKKERYGDENYTNREKSIKTYKLNHNGLTPSDTFKSEEFKNYCKSIYLNNLGVDNHNSVLLETIDDESKKKVDEFVTNSSNKSTKLQDIGERFGKASTESCYLLKQLFFNVLIYRNSQIDYVKNGIPLKESISWLKHNSYLAENPDFIITPGSEKCAHYRCGYFKYCGSDYYVNMKGKFVWVKPTYVHREIIVGNRNLDSCNTIEDKAINT